MASLIGPPWRRLRHGLLGFFMAFLTKGHRLPSPGRGIRPLDGRATDFDKILGLPSRPLPIRSGCSKRVTDTANGRGPLKRRETAPSLHARVMGLLWAEMMDCPDAVPTLDRRDCLVGASLSRSRTVGSETAGAKITAVARLVRALLPDMPPLRKAAEPFTHDGGLAARPQHRDDRDQMPFL